MADHVFAPVGSTILLSGTTSSSRVALSGYVGGNFRVLNLGPDTVFLAQGDSTITAVAPTAGTPANGMPIAAGATEVFSLVGTNVAGICPSSTASVYITGGQGI